MQNEKKMRTLTLVPHTGVLRIIISKDTFNDIPFGYSTIDFTIKEIEHSRPLSVALCLSPYSAHGAPLKLETLRYFRGAMVDDHFTCDKNSVIKQINV